MAAPPMRPRPQTSQWNQGACRTAPLAPTLPPASFLLAQQGEREKLAKAGEAQAQKARQQRWKCEI
jgi:hypothetical protein